MKIENSVSRRILILILIIAVITGIFIPVIYHAVENSNAVKEISVPDGVPLIKWNNSNQNDSMKLLSDYLINLTPKVAIKNAPEFKWKDICPFHFWVKNFSVTTYENAEFKVFNFIYSSDAENNRQMASEIEKEAGDIIDTVRETSGTDKWENILSVHDELIRRTEFVSDDENTGHTHDLYGALAEHKAVCQGYTYAFNYILEKMGYQSTDIYSDEHIWSKVDTIDSSEKYIDVTWDDYNNADRFGNPYIHHDFFCITKREMELFDEHKPEDRSDKEPDTTDGDNYYKKRGYYISKGDLIGFQVCAMEQFKSGKNLLEFRFESLRDFNKANEWTKSILAELGYDEKYYIYSKSELLTFSAGLYVPEDSEETSSSGQLLSD